MVVLFWRHLNVISSMLTYKRLEVRQWFALWYCGLSYGRSKGDLASHYFNFKPITNAICPMILNCFSMLQLRNISMVKLAFLRADRTLPFLVGISLIHVCYLEWVFDYHTQLVQCHTQLSAMLCFLSRSWDLFGDRLSRAFTICSCRQF